MIERSAVQANSTARVLETISTEMLEWSLDDFTPERLPNFYPGKRLRTHLLNTVVVDRATFTKSSWGGSAEFHRDATAALKRTTSPVAKQRIYEATCDSEREAVATSIMVELFSVQDLSPPLRSLPAVADMNLMTVTPHEIELFSSAMREWIN